ncbi:MAG: hypothetical protein O3A18_13265, partial [Planctomycetota bacterium]|nr:hypothetical protein [Planctomycetota bacterium]
DRPGGQPGEPSPLVARGLGILRSIAADGRGQEAEASLEAVAAAWAARDGGLVAGLAAAN